MWALLILRIMHEMHKMGVGDQCLIPDPGINNLKVLTAEFIEFIMYSRLMFTKVMFTI